MPTHWTYRPFDPSDGLFQGDIIAREPLLEVLGKVHAHFCDPKYLAFIVVTQTCDLVVRKGRCKTQYISLAVIRSISSLLPDLLTEMCRPPAPGVYPEESRVEVEEFLHRVLNQNEQAHGMVYLYPDGDLGFAEHAVALLRVSIALRSREHYELLRTSRVGRLDTEYRNKMGWLAGNLFSRVDTTDWGEKEQGEEKEKAIIRELLDTPTDGRGPLWLPTVWLQAAQKKVDLKTVEAAKLEETIRTYAPKPPVEVAVGETKKLVDVLRTDFSDQPAAAFNNRISTDPCILPLARQGAISAVHATLGHLTGDRFWSFGERVSTDTYLREQIVAALQEAATTFLKRKGPRGLNDFIAVLQELNLFPGPAAARVGFLAEESFDAGYLEHKATVDAGIAALKIPTTLVEHLRSVALAAIQESLPERLGKRLENSLAFKGALKPK